MPFHLHAEWADMQAAGRLATDVPMSLYTTLKIGGKADILADPADDAELNSILRVSRAEGIPVTVLGRGSNLVVRDGGIRGVTVRIGPKFSGFTLQNETITAKAGTPITTLAVAAANAGLSGLESVSGIPGAVGGGIIMNCGAYGRNLSESVERVYGITMGGSPFSFAAAQMDFGYRTCRLTNEAAVVTGAVFRFSRAEKTEILRQMEAFNGSRREKQPLDMPSCGSVFKRPHGHYAGALIEGCGLMGTRIGACEVSRVHAGFIVNTGGGTAHDFLALMDLVRGKVLKETGVMLEPEVIVVGEDR
ncbi:MAG: UDP-N-acetylmuramate dehydrogenase [Clostridia bacterium]|nr:UDP-N-acetylmuramate dehydrogenase [Clostridia bacterium]